MTRDDALQNKSKYWGDAKFCDYSAPDVVAWKLARSAIEHENSLVNHRMTWFISSQAFLFSTFILVFLTGSKGDLKIFEPLLVPILMAIGLFAMYVCLVTQDGLDRAFLAIDAVTRQYNELNVMHTPDLIVPPLHYWLAPKIFNLQRLPLVTLFLWVLLVITCIAYAVPDLRDQLKKLTVEHVLYGLALILVFGFGYVLRGSRFGRYSQIATYDPSKRVQRDV